ncbi:MAG: hemolysin III family protein [Xanthomonadales bacterium]|nr:hemolysin III family protein [Xanthomonadales bacterium]
MTIVREPTYYAPTEERINILSHAMGLLFSIAALLALVTRALLHGTAWHLVSFSVFAISLIALYTASTAYHSTRDPSLRIRLRTVDHATIYVLIAGTYTPFALVTLQGSIGWLLFAITWGMAVTGIVLKLFFTGRYNQVSTLMYVFMGWLIVFFIKPLIAQFPSAGLAWLLAGGISYTLGAVLYSIPKVPYHHAIFHLFVVLGSFCHFIAVYAYVLPRA